MMRRPTLARHARYRWDDLRRQHQLVFPEGLLVLNESGAAIVRLLDGRTIDEIAAGLSGAFEPPPDAQDVADFVERLAEKGLLRDVDC